MGGAILHKQAHWGIRDCRGERQNDEKTEANRVAAPAD